MGASKKKQLLNSHVKNYVQTVFAYRLHEEGFSSFEERDICWYRFKNREIINTVIFHTSWNAFPIFLDACYGIYPLFSEIFFARSAYGQEGYCQECFDSQAIIRSDFTFLPFSEDACVYAPLDNGHGIHVLDNIILPKMGSVESIADCYNLHKQLHIDRTKDRPEYRFRFLSNIFIDEAIYMDDQEVYPYCQRQVRKSIEFYEEMCTNYPNNPDYKRQLEDFKLRKHVLLNNARDQYLKILEQSRQKNIAMLQKHHGIVVP